MIEAKIIACWIASWSAALGVFWVGMSGVDSFRSEDGQFAFICFILALSIGAAVAAWQAVVHWWPER